MKQVVLFQTRITFIKIFFWQESIVDLLTGKLLKRLNKCCLCMKINVDPYENFYIT